MLVKQNINAKAVRFLKKTFLKRNTTLMERKKKSGMKKMKEDGIRTTIYNLRLINEEFCTLV